MDILMRHGSSGPWREPSTTAYGNEAELQHLIAESPQLLPGVGELAIAVRELAVAAAGFADVVVVEADGEITLCECKLASNADIRRSVIGQILAYAAALSTFSFDDLDAAFTARGGSLLTAVEAGDESAFRDAVESNLAAGAFRLVIAVDEITEELRDTVLFLNAHTTPGVRILALALRRAGDHDVQVLLPQTYGEEGAERKRRQGRGWTEAELEQAMREQATPLAVDRAMKLFQFCHQHGRLFWGEGTSPSANFWLGDTERSYVAISFYSSGVAVNFDFLRPHRARFSLERLVQDLREVPGTRDYLTDAEVRDFRLRPTMALDRVLTSDDDLIGLTSALERALPADAEPPLASKQSPA